MAPRKTPEERLLSLTERELVDMTRPRSIPSLKLGELKAIQKRLRVARDRAKRIARTQEREMAGSIPPRARRPASDNTGSVGKAEVLVEALQRISLAIRKLTKPTLAESAKKALALKRAAKPPSFPGSGRTAKTGAVAKPSTKAKVKRDPREIGRVSQAGKRAQAKRDTRR